MSGSEHKLESSKLAEALAQAQREQRQEEEAAMRRQAKLADRLATELAKRSDPSGPP